MNYSLIDIGSNSIRLNVYEIHETTFKLLFHSKIMAGLAGYVEKDKLSKEGIHAAIDALLEFKNILKSLSVKKSSVFATASLRNIKNTEKVVKKLNEATGFQIEIIDGEEEALLSYYGAKLELSKIPTGIFADIGGASTEFISFTDHVPGNVTSYPIGSLNLYRKYVRKIIPGEKALKHIDLAISDELETNSDFAFEPHAPLICVGGTARAVMKIARTLYQLPADCNTLSAKQVNEIYKLLTTSSKKSIHLILRMCPDRIHTIIPGLSIMTHILHLYHAKEIIISNYGIREGFLCKKIIQSDKTTMSLPKTEK